MATLPERRYSERGLQVSQPTPVSPEAAATTGKMFVAIGDEVSDLAQKLEKAHLVAEEIKADSIFEKKSADIQARAALEQDVTPEKLKNYQAEYDKAQEEAAGAISIEAYRGLYKTKVSSKSTVGKYKLADTFHTKFKDIANSEYANLREMYKANFLASNNPKEKEMAIQELGEKIQARISAGYVTREDGQKEYQETIKDWNKQQAYQDIEGDPQGVLNELNKENGGNYSEIDPAIRKTLRETATSRVQKAIQEQKNAILEDKNATGVDLTRKALKGEYFDLADIDRRRALGAANLPGGITDSAARALTQYLNGPIGKAQAEERGELLYAVPEKFFDVDKDGDNLVDTDVKLEKISGYRAAVFEAHQKGLITKEELDDKISASEEAFSAGLQGVASKGYKNAQKSWKFYKNWFSKNLNGFEIKTPEGRERYKMTKSEVEEGLAFVGNELMNRMRSGEIADSQVQEVTTQILGKYMVSKYPQLASKIGTPTAVVSDGQVWETGKSDAKPDTKKTTTAADYKTAKAGDVLTLGGKKYRVVTADPGGDHDLEEI